MPPSSLDIASTFSLNTGALMPRLGLGVYLAGRGEGTRHAVGAALNAGYRHIDTAAFYRNEKEVGEAIRASGLARDDVFVTTKLWNDDQGYDSALRAFEKSEKNLGLGPVDLYLIHWPVPGKRLDSWRGLGRLLQEGRCRAIGVSNFLPRHLDELTRVSATVPAANQIELSPFLHQQETVDYCRSKGIAVVAYSPLTKSERLDELSVARIGRRHRKSPAQVLIRWSLQKGFATIPKSSSEPHIRENAAVFDFTLSAEEMDELDALECDYHSSWNPASVR